MYRCDLCDSVFDKPRKVFEQNNDGENRWGEHFLACPVCGESHFHTAQVCPVCGEWMTDKSACCRRCLRKLRIKFADFLHSLEPSEVDQLDDWLDGVSIKDFFNK